MFIYEKAPFPSCHASTIVEVEKDHYLAAWFGGKDEGAKDVQIWGSRFEGKAWSTPEVWGTEPGYPTWNPVLHFVQKDRLALWYKAGPSPQTWTGYVRWSSDAGKTWSKVEMMPAGFFGPVRAKPITLKSGTLLAGTSLESHNNWTPFVDRSTDGGKTWLRSNSFEVPGKFGQIQVALMETTPDTVVALMRSKNPRKVCRSVSTDGGKTFSPAEPLELPNPSTGLDVIRYDNGDVYLICNPVPLGRTPISLYKSTDDGKTWGKVIDFDAGNVSEEFSYPAMIKTADGHLAITYTWHRTHIKFIVFDPKSGKLVVA
jgi:predicted neuraminidase